jgi:hypothetical protein
MNAWLWASSISSTLFVIFMLWLLYEAFLGANEHGELVEALSFFSWATFWIAAVSGFVWLIAWVISS